MVVLMVVQKVVQMVVADGSLACLLEVPFGACEQHFEVEAPSLVDALAWNLVVMCSHSAWYIHSLQEVVADTCWVGHGVEIADGEVHSLAYTCLGFVDNPGLLVDSF